MERERTVVVGLGETMLDLEFGSWQVLGLGDLGVLDSFS